MEKNILQEYCQKKKIAFPIYKMFAIGEPHNPRWGGKVELDDLGRFIKIKIPPSYKSKIEAERNAAAEILKSLSKPDESIKVPIDKEEKHYDAEESDKTLKIPKITKIDKHDEMKASELSDDLDLDSEIDAIKKTTIYNAIYLIDLENKHYFAKPIDKKSLYIGFLNSLHHTRPKYKDWHVCLSDNIQKEITASNNNRLLYLIDGGVSDLVDHYMTAMSYSVIKFVKSLKDIPVINIISADRASWCTHSCLDKLAKFRKLNLKIVNDV